MCPTTTRVNRRTNCDHFGCLCAHTLRGNIRESGGGGGGGANGLLTQVQTTHTSNAFLYRQKSTAANTRTITRIEPLYMRGTLHCEVRGTLY